MAKWMGLEIPFWLLVAVGLGFVLLAILQAPSSSVSSGSGRLNSDSAKTKQGKEQDPPASDAARDVGKRLGVNVAVGVGAPRRRVPVTVYVNDVALRKERDGEWVAIESAIRVLALLNEVASVFLVAWVESDLDENLVKDIARSSGLTSPSVGPSSSKPPAGFAAIATGIPEHRLLFCSSLIGQVAVVRQLASSLHIGGPIALLEGICRFVPSLLRIDPSAVEPLPEAAAFPAAQPEKETTTSSSSNRSGRGGGYSLEWREFKSLAAAAGLPLVTPGSESTTGSDDGEEQQSIRSSASSSSAESDVDSTAVKTTTIEGTHEDGTDLDGMDDETVTEMSGTAPPPTPIAMSSDDEGGGTDLGQSDGTIQPLPLSPPALS